MTTSRFARKIRANLDYWLNKTLPLTDRNVSDYINDIHAIHRAVEFGLALENTRTLAADLILQIDRLIDAAGMWLGWIPHIEQAIMRTDSERLIKLQRQLAFSLVRINHQEQAISLLTSAIQTAQQHELWEQLALTYVMLGQNYIEQHDNEMAQIQISAVQDIVEYHRLDVPFINACVCFIRGRVYTNSGKTDAAIIQFKQAVAIWRQIGEISNLVESLQQLGWVYTTSKDYDSSLPHLVESVELSRTLAHQYQLARGLNQIGLVYLYQKKASEAAYHFIDAYDIVNKSGNDEMKGWIANNLGTACLRMDNYLSAEDWLCNAIVQFTKQNNQLELANSTGNLGEVYLKLGDNDKAIYHLDCAVTALALFPDNYFAQMKLNRFADLLATIKQRSD